MNTYLRAELVPVSVFIFLFAQNTLQIYLICISNSNITGELQPRCCKNCIKYLF